MILEKKIDRRALFFGSKKRQVSSSLDPYDQPLTQQQVYHLLRRTNFGVSYSVAQQLIGKSADAAVEWLLDNATVMPNSFPAWINDGLKSPYDLPEGQAKVDAIKSQFDQMYNQNQELKIWWMQLMQADTQSIREKMTLFWHGHFTTQSPFMPAQLMFRQNQLLRTLHQANLKTFLEKITLDGAMLLYLNGFENSKAAPNENYARELLELFTLGIGNYDEWDIREIAKLLTGWRYNYFIDNASAQGLFVPKLDLSQHNTDPKAVFYEIINTNFPLTQDNVYKYELQVLVNLIVTVQANALATFISKKIYRFFVYSNPDQTDQTVIDGMAATFKGGDGTFQIRPVLAQLLKSKHFFDDANIGIQIKSPAEMVMGFSKYFAVDFRALESLMTQLGQELLNPPNVAGWKGYHAWVSTKTLPLAIATFSSFVDSQANETIANWAKQFPSYSNASDLTQTIVELFLPRTVSTATKSLYVTKLLGGTPDYEWGQIIQSDAFAGQKLKVLIKELIKAPDYYLC